MELSREQKLVRAKELRGSGLTYREIGEQLGVSTGTVYRWLNPERVAPYRNGRAINPERARALDKRYSREKRYYVDCPQCGNKMHQDSSLCEGCRADDVDRRARRIEAWWAEGKLMREIADLLGWSRGRLSMEFSRLRAKGYGLPYRRAVYPNGKPRFPEQVPT